MNKFRKSKKVAPQSPYNAEESNMVYVLTPLLDEQGERIQDAPGAWVIDREASIRVHFYDEPINSSHQFTPEEFAIRFPGIWEDIRDCYEA